MLSRTLKRALLDPKYGLPPTFLLPWTASLTTLAQSSVDAVPTISDFAGAKPATPLPPKPRHEEPLQLSQNLRILLPALRAQRQIYVTIHIHGRAYLLTEGDTLRLPFRMKDVEPGDVLRLNRALYLGSRDFTLKPGKAVGTPKNGHSGLDESASSNVEIETSDASQSLSAAPHFVPNVIKNKYAYLDERLFVCRALVMGTESEPLRIKEKTKRRQRHIKHVKSKHRYTILKIKELRVNSVEQIDNNDVD